MASVAYREPLSTTVGKRMIFTGPDYRKDHLPQVQQHPSYIGEKRPVLEKTGDLSYLWRPASHISVPAKYKHEYVGEIGWGIPEFGFINKTRLGSGFHIKEKLCPTINETTHDVCFLPKSKYTELSRAANDEITHRYQNPCAWQNGAFKVYLQTPVLLVITAHIGVIRAGEAEGVQVMIDDFRREIKFKLVLERTV